MITVDESVKGQFCSLREHFGDAFRSSAKSQHGAKRSASVQAVRRNLCAQTRANALKQFVILNAPLLRHLYPKMLNVVHKKPFTQLSLFPFIKTDNSRVLCLLLGFAVIFWGKSSTQEVAKFCPDLFKGFS